MRDAVVEDRQNPTQRDDTRVEACRAEFETVVWCLEGAEAEGDEPGDERVENAVAEDAGEEVDGEGGGRGGHDR